MSNALALIPGYGPANVEHVRRDRREPEQLVVPEDRYGNRDVRRMRGAEIRVVVHDHVTIDGTATEADPSAPHGATPTPPGATAPPCQPGKAAASTGTSCTSLCARGLICRWAGRYAPAGKQTCASWSLCSSSSPSVVSGPRRLRWTEATTTRTSTRPARPTARFPWWPPAHRTNSGTGEGPIDRGSSTFKRLYRARSAVERELGRLKHHLGLAPLRTRGLARVQLHADLCLLTRLALAAVNSRP